VQHRPVRRRLLESRRATNPNGTHVAGTIAAARGLNGASLADTLDAVTR
jgi:hypothetical protein